MSFEADQAGPSTKHGPTTSGKNARTAVMVPMLEKSIPRKQLMPFPESDLYQLENSKAITPVLKAQHVFLDDPNDTAIHDLRPDKADFRMLTLTLREKKVKVKKPVNDQMRAVEETQYIVQLYENYKSPDTPKALKATFTFREDQTQIWVAFFREMSRVKIYKFYAQKEKKNVAWIFTFPNGTDSLGRQAKFYFAKLKQACESLTKLAYSNVDRRAVAPAAAQDNFHHMMSRSKTSSMLLIAEEDNEQPEVAEPTTNPSARQHLRIVLDGAAHREDDWIFTGAWNDPKLIAMIKEFGVGWDIDGRPQPSTIKNKKSKTKKKKSEEENWGREQRDLHRDANVNTQRTSSHKRSLLPDDSPGRGPSRKKVTLGDM